MEMETLCLAIRVLWKETGKSPNAFRVWWPTPTPSNTRSNSTRTAVFSCFVFFSRRGAQNRQLPKFHLFALGKESKLKFWQLASLSGKRIRG